MNIFTCKFVLSIGLSQFLLMVVMWPYSYYVVVLKKFYSLENVVSRLSCEKAFEFHYLSYNCLSNLLCHYISTYFLSHQFFHHAYSFVRSNKTKSNKTIHKNKKSKPCQSQSQVVRTITTCFCCCCI